MSWHSELRTIIQRDFEVGEVFSLEDVYEYEDYFSDLYPRNRHVRDKLRQTLQRLRSSEIVEFIDDQGNYRRIK
jgi:hypothetical protein